MPTLRRVTEEEAEILRQKHEERRALENLLKETAKSKGIEFPPEKKLPDGAVNRLIIEPPRKKNNEQVITEEVEANSFLQKIIVKIKNIFRG